MTLTRVWTPSGNYSNGGAKRIIVLHSTEGFTGVNGAYDCAKYFQTDCGASSQVCIDNNRGKVWECVSRQFGSWTQCNYNSVSVSAEQCGYASWSRDYWLTNRENELRNAADWVAEEAAHFGIPIVDLSSSQAQGGGSGVCYHSELGSSGCGHGDPGSGYPLDKVLEWAKGGTGALAGEEDMTPAVAYSENGQCRAYRGPDGNVHYAGPETGWDWITLWASAKSGVDLAIADNGDTVISYIGGNNHYCLLTRAAGTADWVYADCGGNA